MRLMAIIKEFRIFFIGVLLSTCLTATGQEIAPYFKNYLKTEYQGENANWDLTQHSNGTIYVANNKNLLSFNGDFWDKYSLPSKSVIRSVNVINDTLYSGSFQQFGYWLKNSKNELKYISLSDALDQKEFNNDEIWKIISKGHEILFQSFNKLYVYNTLNKTIKTVSFGNISAVYSFLIRDNLFIGTRNNGIFQLADNKIIPLEWSDPLRDFTIQSIADYDEGLLIATQLNGLYYYKDSILKKWSFSSNGNLENPEINNIMVFDDLISIGTINNGLMIYDSKGKLKYSYTKGNGLANNTVLRQFIDHDNNLWLALDNGLAQIFLDSKVYSFNDKSGLLGTVYSIAKDGENLVLGSNHGAFYLNNSQLEIIPSSNGQVWDLTKVGDEIICGHNNGTYSIQNNKITKISPNNGGMGFVNIPGTNYYLQPNYGGVTKYEKQEGLWKYVNFNEIDFPVSSVFVDKDKNLWIKASHKGVYRYEFSPDFNRLKLMNSFEDKDEPYQIFTLNSRVFLTRKNKIFKYNTIHNILERDQILETNLKPFETITGIDEKVVEINSEAGIRISNISGDELFNINDPLLNSRIVKNYKSSKVSNNDVYLFLDDGFLKLESSYIDIKKIQTKIYLEQVKVNGKTMPLKSSLSIPFSENSIQIKFSSNSPGDLSLPLYSYKLEGYNEEWSQPSRRSQVNYHNLPPGDYRLKVRESNSTEKEVASFFSFIVLQPWYLNFWAWLGYAVILILILYLVHFYNKNKFKRKRRLLEKELEYKQKLEFQKQNFESNNKIAQLEQEKLKTQLKSKSKELASYAALMARKEEMLNEIESEIVNSNIQKENKTLYSKLMNIKEQQSNSQNDWALFDKNFNEVHEDFFKELQSKYPNLTPKDLKLCAYLVTNLSSKEIAPLVGITFRSVELHRYRLRKKFDLPKNKNLVKFLHQLI